MVENIQRDYVKYYFDHDSIGTVFVDEPFGFKDDDLKYIRHDDYHGIFTLFSNNLEFYGESRDIIKTFYDTYGIKGKLKLGRMLLVNEGINKQRWVFDYDGYLDLKTYLLYEEKVVCKFDASNITDLLKSRESTEVEIERTSTLDNKSISKIPINEIQLTPRNILKTDSAILDETQTLYFGGYPDPFLNTQYYTPLTKLISDVHDDFSATTQASMIPTSPVANNMFWVMLNPTPPITLKVKIEIEAILPVIFNGLGTSSAEIRLQHFSWDGAAYVPISDYGMGSIVNGKLTSEQTVTLNAVNDSLALVLKLTAPSITFTKYNITVSEDSSMPVLDVNNKFVFVNDLLSKMVEINVNRNIFKSDYYSIGLGYLRGFISGIWARNFDDKSKGYKSPVISFKDLISSLNAVDNIGLGIQKDGNRDVIRIEDLKYFYQNFVTITIPEVINLTEEPYLEAYFNELEFGYTFDGKYEKEMGLDEPNLSSKYATPLNTVSNKYSKLSKVRADSYGLEFERLLQQKDYPTTDGKGDLDNWFLDIKDRLNETLPYTEKLWADRFSVEPEGVYSPETLTKSWFSPLNNMLRHSWWFSQGLLKNIFEYTTFTSSTGNSKLKTTPIGGVEHIENQDFLNYNFERPRLNGNLIKFEFDVNQDIKNQLKGYTNVNGDLVPNVYGLIEFIYKGVKKYGYLKSVETNGKNWEVLEFNNIPKQSNKSIDVRNGVVDIYIYDSVDVYGLDSNIRNAPIMGRLLGLSTNNLAEIRILDSDYESATDIDGNLAGYRFYYKKSIDVTWTFFGKYILPKASRIITGLLENTNYDVRITAYDSGTPSLESTPSNILSILTGESTFPIMGTLSSGSITDSSIRLNWTAATDNVGVVGYQIEYKRAIDGIYTFTSVGNNVLTYLLSGLLANTSYNIKVAAIDNTNNADYSNIVTISTLNTSETLYEFSRSGGNTSSNNACLASLTTSCYSLDSVLTIGSIIYKKPNVSILLVGNNLWYQIDGASYRIDNSGHITESATCNIYI